MSKTNGKRPFKDQIAQVLIELSIYIEPMKWNCLDGCFIGTMRNIKKSLKVIPARKNKSVTENR